MSLPGMELAAVEEAASKADHCWKMHVLVTS